jgi:hypothetical protein
LLAVGGQHEWVHRYMYYEQFSTARRQMFARLPLTTEDLEGEQERQRERAEKLAALEARISTA